MKLDESQVRTLQDYLIRRLEPITQADPKVLSQYFIALLRNPKPDDELKKNCVSQLKTFLGEGTTDFVQETFMAIGSGLIKEGDGRGQYTRDPPGAHETYEKEAPDDGATTPPHNPTSTHRIASAVVMAHTNDSSSDEDEDDRDHNTDAAVRIEIEHGHALHPPLTSRIPKAITLDRLIVASHHLGRASTTGGSGTTVVHNRETPNWTVGGINATQATVEELLCHQGFQGMGLGCTTGCRTLTVTVAQVGSE
eukprot:CAMPEP_0198222740 /NCGR_PEP_ID=MMETSP1445-20131203/89448_1 /TAXON_ID=36898 /ORGANISM="Pyramimonas sp., Strain CCMP2087" /LENGTH=251 /DNA_ID=CAMNT_0043901353 /DNA_START=86 /DNA_END=839 /DNA_ORIENTATION=+